MEKRVRKFILNEYIQKHTSMQNKIENQVKQNELYEQATYYLEQTEAYLEYAQMEMARLKKLKKSIELESTAYKRRRIAFIEAELTELLVSIFPEKAFKAELEIDANKLNPSMNVTLIDKFGNRRIPDTTEGGCAGDLISISIPVSVLFINGCRIFFLDEALSNASAQNKMEFQDTLEYYTKKGMQIILITQTGDMYEDIDRYEHILDFDSETGYVRGIQCKEMIGRYES